MRSAWIGILGLVLASAANAQISVTTTGSLVPGYVGSTYCIVAQTNGYACTGGLIQAVASGGTAPYTYAISSGAMPPGMSLAADRSFAGKPTATGTYTFTIQATDSKGVTGSGTFSITVNPAFVGALITLALGVPANLPRVCASGGTSTGLPPGLTLGASAVTGTPTALGAFTETWSCANLTVFYPYQVNGAFGASPQSLTLAGFTDGVVAKGVLQVGLAVAGRVFTASATTSDGKPWLSAVANGPSPGTVTATANPAGLAAGRYTGIVNISAVNPTTTINIPVVFNVTAPAAATPRLTFAPASLSFTALRTGPTITKTFSITNIGTGTAGPITFRPVSGQLDGVAEFESHISISPGSGNVTPSTPLIVSVTLNPNLSGTHYFGSVVGTGPAGGTFQIPIDVQISATPKLWWSQNAVFLSARGDNPGLVRQPVSKTIGLYTDGNLTTGVEVFPGSGVIIPSAPWLTVTPPGPFSLTPAGGGITFNVTSAGLPSGDFYGVVIADQRPRPSNVSAQTTVVFRVIPYDAPGGLFSADIGNALTFSTSSAFSPPISFPITTINTTPLSLTLSVEFNDGQVFAAISPAATTTVAGAPAFVTLSQIIDRAALPASPNIVTGNIVIQPGGGLPPTKVPIALIKFLRNQVANSATRAADCVPTKLVPLRAAPLQNFAATVGLPQDINVTVVDDCGDFTTASSVTARFSNGDASVELVPTGKGVFTGSWTGRTESDNVLVTITALSANQSLSGAVEVGGQLAANPNRPPALAEGGVLNGGSFAIGGPLAPGSFVSLFGEKLANASASAPSVPLGNALAGSSVLIGGQLAPVFYASDGQVNAIIPYGIPTGGPLPVIAVRDGVLSQLQSVPIVPAAPGIFQYGAGRAIAVGPNGLDLTDAAHPVRAGQTIVVYCTGLGEVIPAVPAGTQTALAVLSRTVNTVTATIGGVAARVDFAGLTPGQTGLYQVNIVVPAGVTVGDQVPVVLSAAGANSASAVISVR